MSWPSDSNLEVESIFKRCLVFLNFSFNYMYIIVKIIPKEYTKQLYMLFFKTHKCICF